MDDRIVLMLETCVESTFLCEIRNDGQAYSALQLARMLVKDSLALLAAAHYCCHIVSRLCEHGDVSEAAATHTLGPTDSRGYGVQ